MHQCWLDDEKKRPTFSKILSLITQISGGRLPSLVDSMIKRLEYHTNHLEEIVQGRFFIILLLIILFSVLICYVVNCQFL